MVATTGGWLCIAKSLCRPEAGSTKPIARASAIPSLWQRLSIAASRLSSVPGAEYVLQSAPKLSSIASVSRPSSETRQNSIGKSGPLAANLAAIFRSRGSHTDDPHARTTLFTTPPPLKAPAGTCWVGAEIGQQSAVVVALDSRLRGNDKLVESDSI